MTASSANEKIDAPSNYIVVVDDDSDFGELIFAVAQTLNFNCVVTTNATDFLAALNPEVTLAVIDLMMPDIDGIELLRALGQRHSTFKIVLMSGIDKRILETAEELAKSLGLTVAGHLQKPFRVIDLENILKNSVKHSAMLPSASPRSIAITEDELRQAIEREEFVLHYQPQIEISTGKVIGLEALVRWQHPQQGLIFPDAFIERAEAFGLIDDLGWLVAKRGLSEIKQFAGKDGVAPILSLNVSPYSLHDLKLPEMFVVLAKQYAIQPSDVTLEITESGLFKNLSKALDILSRLRMKQFQLSIDDFGTGFAMMQQLRRVPATELKIDKSFVQDMDTQDSARVMVHTSIGMAHELNMKAVAEGVETAEQLEFLRANGCDIVQGYFFSRPLPPAALQTWLANRS